MQFESHQNYHFQIIGQNMLKYRKKARSGVFMGPKHNFLLNFKLIFGACTKNILMCSQVKFEPDEPHSL